MTHFARFARWETLLGGLAVAVVAWASLTVDGFTSSINLSQAVAGMSEKALIALPLMLLILAREIDLSVASILALSSVVFGMLIRADVPSSASGCTRWSRRSGRWRSSADWATSCSAPTRSTSSRSR